MLTRIEESLGASMVESPFMSLAYQVKSEVTETREGLKNGIDEAIVCGIAEADGAFPF
jgi:hypothetical protein